MFWLQSLWLVKNEAKNRNCGAFASINRKLKSNIQSAKLHPMFSDPISKLGARE